MYDSNTDKNLIWPPKSKMAATKWRFNKNIARKLDIFWRNLGNFAYKKSVHIHLYLHLQWIITAYTIQDDRHKIYFMDKWQKTTHIVVSNTCQSKCFIWLFTKYLLFCRSLDTHVSMSEMKIIQLLDEYWWSLSFKQTIFLII